MQCGLTLKISDQSIVTWRAQHLLKYRYIAIGSSNNKRSVAIIILDVLIAEWQQASNYFLIASEQG